MSNDLGEYDILVTDPPLIKPHWKSNSFETEIGQQRNSDHIEELLLMICICCEQRIGMFG